jgi:hypothetical protein
LVLQAWAAPAVPRSPPSAPASFHRSRAPMPGSSSPFPKWTPHAGMDQEAQASFPHGASPIQASPALSKTPATTPLLEPLLPFFFLKHAAAPPLSLHGAGHFLVRARAVSSSAFMARCLCPPSHGALIPPCAAPLFFYLLPAPRNSCSEQRTSCCPRRAANGELSSTSPHGYELPSPAARLPLPWKPAASSPLPNRCPFFSSTSGSKL